MATLSVSYDSVSHKLTITGGDGGGADVSVDYQTTESILWNRVGTNFSFTDITFSPTSTPFTEVTVTEDQISLIDPNNNTARAAQEWSYTIEIATATDRRRIRIDPKVINKGIPNLETVVIRAAPKRTRPARKTPAKKTPARKRTKRSAARKYGR